MSEGEDDAAWHYAEMYAPSQLELQTRRAELAEMTVRNLVKAIKEHLKHEPWKDAHTTQHRAGLEKAIAGLD
jgi:hypothetical protein